MSAAPGTGPGAETGTGADPGPVAPASKRPLRFWIQMLKTSKSLEAGMREMLRTEFDTTLPRFDVMAMLDRWPDGLKMSRLSAELMVSNGNVTGIVERLVGEGLVERVAVAGDRRATRVRLTGAGRDAFARMAERHADWVAERLAHIPGAELDRAMTLMTDIRRIA